MTTDAFLTATSELELWSLDSFINAQNLPRSGCPSGAVGVIATKEGKFVWFSRVEVPVPEDEASANDLPRSSGGELIWEWNPGKAMHFWSLLKNAEETDSVFRPLAHTQPELVTMRHLLDPLFIECKEVGWEDLSKSVRWFLLQVAPVSTCLFFPSYCHDTYRDKMAKRVNTRLDKGPPVSVNSIYWGDFKWKEDCHLTLSDLWCTTNNDFAESAPSSGHVLCPQHENTKLAEWSWLPADVAGEILSMVVLECLGMAAAPAQPVYNATRLRCVCTSFRDCIDSSMESCRATAFAAAHRSLCGEHVPLRLPLRAGRATAVLRKPVTWKVFASERAIFDQKGGGHDLCEIAAHHAYRPGRDNRGADSKFIANLTRRQRLLENILRVNPLAKSKLTAGHFNKTLA